MKNLFLVINKEKIYAYVVSIMTIVVIFFMSSMINSDLDETEITASNIVETNQSSEVKATSSNEIINDNENIKTGDVVIENETNKNNYETSTIGDAISTNIENENTILENN